MALKSILDEGGVTPAQLAAVETKADQALAKPSVDRRGPITLTAGSQQHNMQPPTADVTMLRVTCNDEFGVVRLSRSTAPLTVAANGKQCIMVVNESAATHPLRVTGGTLVDDEPTGMTFNGLEMNVVFLAAGESASFMLWSDTEFFVLTNGTIDQEA